MPDVNERYLRTVEVRPSWSALEWAQISRAAAAVSMPPATWAADVLAGVVGAGPGPGRCTGRAQLWRALHERWQSMFWAAFALRPNVQTDVWPRVGGIVGAGGLVIGGQSDEVDRLERRRVAEAIRAVAAMVDTLGPGARRRAAALTATPGGQSQAHRAKVLLTPTAHETLTRSARAGGWTPSDYAGAATATAAGLILADTAAADEAAVLQLCLTRTRATAARLAGLVADDTAEMTPVEWDTIAGELTQIEALIRRTAAARTPTDTAQTDTAPGQVSVDVRAAIPGVFVTLGWAARWGVGGP